ncbi:hypothetical protein PRIC1_013173 [Phytophthora ramorum]
MGRWQREYERDWRDYTQRAIADRFGKYAVQFSPSVTSEDEQLLREVLADVGIAHVPPNHSRWHAPIPASQSLSAAFGPHDSIISNGSYVYNTPPSADSQSMFPAFSSQDFGSQTTSQRRVSASQRLQLRMANVSPIADNRRASIEMAGTISPPSGATKSPWSPGAAPWSPKPTGKSRRTPRRSLEPSFRADDLDVSMQSMQLSDDERTRMDDVDVEVEDTQMLDMSEVHEGGNASKGEEIEEQYEHTQIEEKTAEEVVVETQMVDHHDAAEDMNVSKELIFSSDSEEEDEKEQKETAEPEAEMAEEEKPIIEMSGTGEKSIHSSLPSAQPKDNTERPPWSSEPDFEFGDGNEYVDVEQQQENDRPDTEMLEPEQLAVESLPHTSDAFQNEHSGLSKHEPCRKLVKTVNACIPHSFVNKKNVVPDPHSFIREKTNIRFTNGFLSKTYYICIFYRFISQKSFACFTSRFISKACSSNASHSFVQVSIIKEARQPRRIVAHKTSTGNGISLCKRSTPSP